jgi:endonuclease YncB( thermonuclease family)
MKKIALIMVVLFAFIPFVALASSNLDTSSCKISKIKLDDGDSFDCNGEHIRVLGIDTPEITHVPHGIYMDQPMGREAAEFTKHAIENAKRVTIIRGGKDPYGRTLAHVLIDGELLGVILIRARLAYETISRYGDNGLPEYAFAVEEAWKTVKKPDFEDPHDWRMKNQKRP